MSANFDENVTVTSPPMNLAVAVYVATSVRAPMWLELRAKILVGATLYIERLVARDAASHCVLARVHVPPSWEALSEGARSLY
eukprot:CAMPEP_0180647278 /NCGR_PEP_ID=MMETSP1037_2-20121125/50219_1 /TAXON_ID=632150 /ORGANISM="Azadinium spinosum, Strain 3D9" /LENGTH=82 /DNA_ID=CAMNT_0022671755 /DNA_START=63 /DNA_END=310 /DNA_ORIENTATION=+